MVNTWTPPPDQRNIANRTLGCCTDQPGNLAGLGFTWPENLIPDFDQNTLMLIGGGLAAVLLLSTVLGGRKSRSSATARAKAAYAKEYADLTGRMPRSL